MIGPRPEIEKTGKKHNAKNEPEEGGGRSKTHFPQAPPLSKKKPEKKRRKLHIASGGASSFLWGARLDVWGIIEDQ